MKSPARRPGCNKIPQSAQIAVASLAVPLAGPLVPGYSPRFSLRRGIRRDVGLTSVHLPFFDDACSLSNCPGGSCARERSLGRGGFPCNRARTAPQEMVHDPARADLVILDADTRAMHHFRARGLGAPVLLIGRDDTNTRAGRQCPVRSNPKPCWLGRRGCFWRAGKPRCCAPGTGPFRPRFHSHRWTCPVCAAHPTGFR